MGPPGYGRSVVKQQEIPLAGLRPISVFRAVASFLLAGLVVWCAVAVLLAWSERRNATAEAVREARTLTAVEAHAVVGPALTDQALVPGTPAAAALDQIVRSRVLGARIVRLKIWQASGRIVYSDDRRLIGAQFPLASDERAALAHGLTAAGISDLHAAENRDERAFGKLLQVYQGMNTTGGQPVLFETYQPYTVIAQNTHRLVMLTVPVLLVGLLLLYLVQAPLAYQMARRLNASREEREALLVATLAAADRERTTIAADLHDGVVQGLAGTSLTLTAASRRSREAAPAAAQVMADSAADLRRWIRELRCLVVTITPPALHAQGLAVCLHDLAATLEARGISVVVQVSGVADLPEQVEALVFRAGQEAIRNIARHAGASHVTVVVTREQPRALTLAVRDDGRGFTPADRTARRSGSLGLELLSQLVAAQGGTLLVTSSLRHGTALELRLPLTTGDTTGHRTTRSGRR